jgi:phosphoglycolate phosphatase
MGRTRSIEIKAIIFDLDGTIADSFEVFMMALATVLKRKQPLSEEEIQIIRRYPFHEAVRHFGVKSWQIPRFVNKERRELSQHMSQVKVFTGMPEIIKELAELGYQLYVVSSNGQKSISDFLDKLDLGCYVTSIYGDISLRGKALVLKKLMKQERLTAQECVYIGDETRDIEAANKVHMKCIAVGWGFNLPDTLAAYGPDFIANTPADILLALD